MLIDFGFPQRFVQWIMECMITISYTLVLNGGLTKPFKGRKGIRQGDHMSPYLFVLSMEYLQKEMNYLEQNQNFNFHPG